MRWGWGWGRLYNIQSAIYHIDVYISNIQKQKGVDVVVFVVVWYSPVIRWTWTLHIHLPCVRGLLWHLWTWLWTQFSDSQFKCERKWHLLSHLCNGHIHNHNHMHPVSWLPKKRCADKILRALEIECTGTQIGLGRTDDLIMCCWFLSKLWWVLLVGWLVGWWTHQLPDWGSKVVCSLVIDLVINEKGYCCVIIPYTHHTSSCLPFPNTIFTLSQQSSELKILNFS